MANIRHAAAVTAAFFLCSQPCLAADDLRDAAAAERRTGAFAGLSVRLPLGQAAPAKPVARLQLTTVHHMRDRETGAIRHMRAPGLELGAGQSGKPVLTLGGQRADDMQRRLGVGGSTTTVLIVGGVLLVVLVLATVAAATPRPGPREGAFD